MEMTGSSQANSSHIHEWVQRRDVMPNYDKYMRITNNPEGKYCKHCGMDKDDVILLARKGHSVLCHCDNCSTSITKKYGLTIP